ncbi:MAG: energy-coupling factor transporter ATPase [Lachnospiraceae bacterium]|jgi:energy-coupling factor transport system ATP-binding protein|nr:energy-coupling factor transporter ATPase [Lachnospiraceae bacterium]
MGIRVEHLNHIYGAGTAFEQYAVRDVSFEISPGEFVGLMGHTGSGKSTLVQHLNGLLKPTSGRVLYDEEDIHGPGYSLRKLRGKVGLVFQYPEHQLFETDVFTDVCFGPKNLGLTPEECKGRAREALANVGLPEKLWDESPFELSGGEKRRAAIAGVLAMEPEVLVLDEPTAGLDPKGREEILDKIKELHEARHMTVLLVSHSMEDLAIYTDRILVMNQGGLAYDGTPREVFGHYEALEKMGLSAPQITYVAHKLKVLGVPINADVTTVAEATEEILQVWRRIHG